MLSNASVAILVPIRDMNRAIKFYTGKLGGKLSMRGEDEMKDSWAAVKLGRQEYWLVGGAKKSDLAYSTFVVKDIKDEVIGLRKKGVRFLRAEKDKTTTKIDGPINFHSYGAEAFFKDSEGNLMMLWQGM
ncbi:MAG: VOC family protein [Thaumarchaeota archaeon]|nr:VOC family protein [Nitrososphaerota archaeon]